MATQLATTEQSRELSPQREAYAIMKDKAKMFAMSPLIPESLRGRDYETACANCLIALELASLMNEAPLVVMQNIHIVKGKAGFAAQYMIARANASGVFKGRIGWRISGEKQNLSVTAFATLADTGEEVSFTADMAMAQAEGWTSNSKYKTMPEVMLRYRSATFLVRFYAPDVMLGYQTAEEVQDVYGGMAPNAPAAPLSAAMLAAPVDDEQNERDHNGGYTLSEEAAAEGPADEQRGEATHPAQDAAAELIGRAEAASTIIDLNSVRADAEQHAEAIEAYDLALWASVDLALDDAEKRLKGE